MPVDRVQGLDHITAGLERIQRGEVAVLGVPWDGGSSYLRGAALGPGRIREELLSPVRNLCAESGLDLGLEGRLRILPDLELGNTGAAHAVIEAAVEVILERSGRPLSLGGDHSITTSTMRACARHIDTLTLLQIDAHPDLYEDFEGDPRSHASPMARIMEQGLVERLVQVGIRTMTPHQRQQAERFGVQVEEVRDWQDGRADSLGLDGPIYVSLDLDGLDPAYAPGVSHPEPGGLSVRDVVRLLQGIPAPVVAADIVELNPLRDAQGLTAVVAAKLVKELAAKMLEPLST